MTSCTFKVVCRNYYWITLICVAKIKVIAFQMNTYINSTLIRYIVLHPIPPSIAYFSNNERNLLPMQFTLAIFSYVDVKFVINSTGKSKWFCAENLLSQCNWLRKWVAAPSKVVRCALSSYDLLSRNKQTYKTQINGRLPFLV